MIMRITALYKFFPLIACGVFSTVIKLRSSKVPRILRKQLTLLIKVIVVPLMICEFLQVYPTNYSSNWGSNWFFDSYVGLNISTILLTYALFYCSRQIIRLRFLNMDKHVRSPIHLNFMNKFTDLFEQLNNALNLHELTHTTQRLLQEAFSVPVRSIKIYIRPCNESNANQYTEETNYDQDSIEKTVEAIINTKDTNLLSYIKQSKILIYDEIDFNNFYEENQATTATLKFLDNINADIFLPIYKNEKIIAYVVIERFARPHQFYSNVERDEMLVLSSYLNTIINLMQHRDLDTMLAKEKEMCEELYNKHQEINQYKESIRSFLRNNKHRGIGIIFYKNRNFTFCNRSAKELIGTNPNKQEGHHITKILKQLARDVTIYKETQTCTTHDNHGNKLVITAISNPEHNNVIILVYYPEVSDILTKQMELINNPSKWDYLLYLETTDSGRLVNQLIPGSGERLLNFKVELLKTALSTKATLLQLPQEDLKPTVELIHHISLRSNLHILTLQAPENGMEIAIKLFGINQIFDSHNHKEPLLKKLHDYGTLFIENIHFLSLETQEYLAEFIRFGFYRIFKSDQRVFCNVGFVCSTNQDLKTLTDEGKFSKELLEELQKTNLHMPSLLKLPEQEFSELAIGYSEQTLKKQTFRNFLSLTDTERKKLASNRPASLQELKTKVQQLLINKSKKTQIYDETLFDPAFKVTDPQLIEAARLGKQALKDPQIMALLWNKFKNQNKIAAFLGVNRSSVNRRCREYNLICTRPEKLTGHTYKVE